MFLLLASKSCTPAISCHATNFPYSSFTWYILYDHTKWPQSEGFCADGCQGYLGGVASCTVSTSLFNLVMWAKCATQGVLEIPTWPNMHIPCPVGMMPDFIMSRAIDRFCHPFLFHLEWMHNEPGKSFLVHNISIILIQLLQFLVNPCCLIWLCFMFATFTGLFLADQHRWTPRN